jgi:hypothetical protein
VYQLVADVAAEGVLVADAAVPEQHPVDAEVPALAVIDKEQYLAQEILLEQSADKNRQREDVEELVLVQHVVAELEEDSAEVCSVDAVVLLL